MDGLIQHFGADGGIGGVEGEQGGQVGGDHAAALADGAQGAGLAAQRELQGVLLGVGVRGHDGLGGGGAARLAPGQLGRRLGNALGEGINGHGLADDAGGGGQDVLFLQAQRPRRQATALVGQVNAVGRAGVGIAAVYQNGLGMAVRQVGLIHRDGRALHLVAGVHTGGRAAHIRHDEGQVLLIGVGPEAAVYARGLKTLCGADAAGHFLEFHCCISPFPRPPVVGAETLNAAGSCGCFRCTVIPGPRSPAGPASGSCTAPPRRKSPCPDCQTGSSPAAGPRGPPQRSPFYRCRCAGSW